MIQFNPRYEVLFESENIDLKAASKREQCVKSCLNIAEREQARQTLASANAHKCDSQIPHLVFLNGGIIQFIWD